MSLKGTESHTQRPHKEAIHNLSPWEKLLVYQNIAQCIRSGHRNCSVTGREMPLKWDWTILAFIYVQWELFPAWSLGFPLRPYTGTGRKPNVSLEDVIRCCPFTQGHSGEFRFLEVFILRFVKTGTPTPISLPNIRSSAVKKLKSTVPCSNFLSNNSGILPILPSSESLRLDLCSNRSSLYQ